MFNKLILDLRGKARGCMIVLKIHPAPRKAEWDGPQLELGSDLEL